MYGRIKEWWNRQSKANKILSGVGVCCLGVLLLAAIGMLLPEAPATELTVISPKDGTTVENVKNITVQGRTEPNATVTVNGENVTVKSDGNFTCNVPLKQGKNEITVEAKAPNKEAVTVSFAVTVKVQNIKKTGNATKTYSGQYFSFDYPANWKVTNDIGTTVEISPGELGISIIYYDDKSDFAYDKNQLTTLGLAAGGEFMGIEEIDGTECEVYYDPNDMAYTFWFEKNGKYFYVFSHEEHVDVARNVIKTLK